VPPLTLRSRPSGGGLGRRAVLGRGESLAETVALNRWATRSSGSAGGGLFLSQSVDVSQSRTNCLSNDGWCPSTSASVQAYGCVSSGKRATTKA
jgi:hypothetical protein